MSHIFPSQSRYALSTVYVSFEITDSYPFFNPDADKTYTLTDTVTGGIILNDAPHEIVVTINGNKVTEVTPEVVSGENESTLTVAFTYNSDYAGKPVKVTYDVEVKTGANLENKVESQKGIHKTQSIVISPKVSAKITKVDEKTKEKLSGAEFALYVETTQDKATHKLETTTVNDVTKNLITEMTPGDTITENGKWLALVKQSVAADDETDGVTTFTELDADKTYWVVETKAPEGYSLNDSAVKLDNASVTPGTPTLVPASTDGYDVPTWVTENTVDKDSEGNALASTATVSDTTLSSLPSTGGIGTTIFTVGGCAIMILAAGMFFVSRRKASR